MGERSAFHGAPRRIEALAYIVQRIERSGTSPSFGEIGRAMRPAINGTRVRKLVEELVRIGVIERDVGSRRGIRLRDAQRCRVLIAEARHRHGGRHAPTLGRFIVHPCTNEHLPILPLIPENRAVN